MGDSGESVEHPLYEVGDNVRIRYTGTTAEVIATITGHAGDDEVQFLWVKFVDEQRKRAYPTTVISRDVTPVV